MAQDTFPEGQAGVGKGLIVVDGMTKEILADKKFLNDHGLERA